ncbi:ABC transporter permease [Pseudonocardia thermophila]|uniref:ABC transporter permease n=1 Tax=Pseudonocardia thermophila TaxID=1848 RepID=UPI00248F4587|nr:iron ABC transporter permease [Pseudonocardia thermophila]
MSTAGSALTMERTDAEPSLPARSQLFAVIRRWWLPSILIVVLGLLVAYPLAILIYASFRTRAPAPGEAFAGEFTLANYAAILDSSNLIAVANSAMVGILATAAAAVLGGGLAWLVARTDVPLPRLVAFAGLTPLFISPVVAAIAWSTLASPNRGYLNLLFEDLGIDFRVDVYTLPGVILVLAMYYAPYMFLYTRNSLNLMNSELEEAALIHGGNRWHVLRHVTIPLLTPTLLGASAITLVLVVENFPVPQILGANGSVVLIPSQIYTLMQAAPSRPTEASALGMVLLVLMIALVAFQQRAMKRRSFVTVTGKGARASLTRLRGWRWPLFAVAMVYLLLAAVLPFFALIQTALRRSQYVAGIGDLFDAGQWTIDRFIRLIGNSGFQNVLINTAIVGLASAVVGVGLYSVLAYVVARTNLPSRRALHQLAMAPAAVPALVIGIAFLWAWLILPIPIYGTLAILVVAYVARFVPQGFSSVLGNLTQIHDDMEDSAAMAGAGRIRSITWVTVPLVRSGLVSMALLMIVLTLRELSTSIFLFTSRTEVISVRLFQAYETADMATVAWIALILSAALFVLAFFGRRALLGRGI